MVAPASHSAAAACSPLLDLRKVRENRETEGGSAASLRSDHALAPVLNLLLGQLAPERQQKLVRMAL